MSIITLRKENEEGQCITLNLGTKKAPLLEELLETNLNLN
jgi:hypothetical protein